MSAVPRLATPADGVLGVAPRLAVEPGSTAEAALAMAALARDKQAVAFVGGGTSLGLGAPPARLDAVLRTGRMTKVLEHAPADQIVAVEAGITLAALQAHLAPHGQRLALDPPFPARATVGGLVAAGAFGPRRTRYGSPRDLVIGVTVVRADGVVAHGGGKVVKNVAGFDLPRLFCGSLGGLGLVAEVVFRLHPLPEASATVAFEGCPAAEVRSLVRAALDARLEPVAVAALGEPGGETFRLAIRFEGFGPGVADQASRLLALPAAARSRPGARLEADAEAVLWTAHDGLRTAGDLRARASFAPASLGAAAGALRPVVTALGGGGLVLLPTLGIAFVAGTVRDANALAGALAEARALLAADPAAAGTVVIEEAPPAVRARVDVWGPPPAAPVLALLRRLKAELDPDGRLAPGRGPGGL